MKWKIFILAFSIAMSTVLGDVNDDRGANAANVVETSIAVCNNDRSSGNNNNNVPYVTPNEEMVAGMSVIGGLLKVYHNVQMNIKFKNALDQLNSRFDLLEESMNHRFDELEGFIDRKQFESDITDPITILWGQMQAYAMYPGNETYLNAMFECTRQTAWQIATKIHNRLFGPDNTIVTQLRPNKYSNATFMAVKDVIMYRMFQAMMVQSFCLGAQHGPNYNVSNDWQMLRMNSIYESVVQNTLAIRELQETEYFSDVLPGVVSSIVTSNAKGSTREQYAYNLYKQLSSNFSWDAFSIVIADKDCDQISVKSGSGSETGGTPYALWTSARHATNVPLDVYVIRYWSSGSGSANDQLEAAMRQYHKNNIDDWTENVYDNSPFDFILLRSSWFCGGNTVFYGQSSANFGQEATYSEGVADGCIPTSNHAKNTAYDLGFWVRPISISLMPYQ